ncbi:hypothetical protein IWQ56_004670, partial [Coemansia nantahalensis]
MPTRANPGEVDAYQLAAVIASLERLMERNTVAIERSTEAAERAAEAAERSTAALEVLADRRGGGAADQEGLAARVKLTSLYLADLDDNPRFVEAWVEMAIAELQGLSDQDKLKCIVGKVRGPKVRDLLNSRRPGSGFEDFCTRAVELLDPGNERDKLYLDIVARRRYDRFTRTEALSQARLDLDFLQRGTALHRAAEEAIVDALRDILPTHVARSIKADLLAGFVKEALAAAKADQKLS